MLARSETLSTRNKFAVKNENISNKELSEELQKPIIRKFKKRKVYSLFKKGIFTHYLYTIFGALILLMCN